MIFECGVATQVCTYIYYVKQTKAYTGARWLALIRWQGAAYINLVSASDAASREYPAVSQMDVSVGKKGK